MFWRNPINWFRKFRKNWVAGGGISAGHCYFRELWRKYKSCIINVKTDTEDLENEVVETEETTETVEEN